MWMEISIIQGHETEYHFGFKLQSHELNLVLKKTARQVPLAKW